MIDPGEITYYDAAGGKQPDAEIAADFKDLLTKALGELVDLMNSAKARDFDLEFSIATDSTGHRFVQMMRVSREF